MRGAPGMKHQVVLRGRSLAIMRGVLLVNKRGTQYRILVVMRAASS